MKKSQLKNIIRDVIEEQVLVSELQNIHVFKFCGAYFPQEDNLSNIFHTGLQGGSINNSNWINPLGYVMVLDEYPNPPYYLSLTYPNNIPASPAYNELNKLFISNNNFMNFVQNPSMGQVVKIRSNVTNLVPQQANFEGSPIYGCFKYDTTYSVQEVKGGGAAAIIANNNQTWYPSNLNPQYMSTHNSCQECNESHISSPLETFNCDNGSCVDPGNGSGQYLTLQDCEDNCTYINPDGGNIDIPDLGVADGLGNCPDPSASNYVNNGRDCNNTLHPVYTMNVGCQSPLVDCSCCLYEDINIEDPILPPKPTTSPIDIDPIEDPTDPIEDPADPLLDCSSFYAMNQQYQDGCCMKCQDPNIGPNHQCYPYCHCCSKLRERFQKLANIKK